MASSPENLVIGLDLGGTSMVAGLVDRQLEVTKRIEEETPTASQEALLTNILTVIDRLRSHAHAPVDAIGCGIPSMIDRARGRAVMSVNIPLKDFDFVDFMQDRTGLPVFIDNDANVAALAEVRGGAAKGAAEAILITIGTGSGGGILPGGRGYRGATGSAAELGHMVVEA
ncbi:MAG: ROK family protein, partial [Actinomycetota bacterium]